MKIYLIPAVLLLWVSCKTPDKPVKITLADTPTIVHGAKPVVTQQVDSLPRGNWADSLLALYIQHSGNKLVEMNAEDTSTHEQWVFDRVEQRGQSKYFVYHIGHDNSLGEGDGVVYASDSWVYLDSLSHKLYEYQLNNESLKEWKHK